MSPRTLIIRETGINEFCWICRFALATPPPRGPLLPSFPAAAGCRGEIKTPHSLPRRGAGDCDAVCNSAAPRFEWMPVRDNSNTRNLVWERRRTRARAHTFERVRLMPSRITRRLRLKVPRRYEENYCKPTRGADAFSKRRKRRVEARLMRKLETKVTAGGR